MIKFESNPGFSGKYLYAYLTIGSVKIDLGDGDSLTEEQAGGIADALQCVVNEIRMFSERAKAHAEARP